MKRLALMAALALTMFSSVSGLRADDYYENPQYESFSVQNHTDITITYQVTWGSETRTVTLVPGGIWHHARPLSSAPASSAPVVRYTQHGVNRSYRINPSLSEHPQGGWVYHLRHRSDGVRLFNG